MRKVRAANSIEYNNKFDSVNAIVAEIPEYRDYLKSLVLFTFREILISVKLFRNFFQLLKYYSITVLI